MNALVSECGSKGRKAVSIHKVLQISDSQNLMSPATLMSIDSAA